MSWNWGSEAKELGISILPESILNIGYEVSDRICEKGHGEHVAIIWRGKSGEEKKLTYNYLASESSRFATFLKYLGVSKGDRVFTYSDRIPQHYIAIIGAVKAGAVLGPLFSSFGKEAIKDRLYTAGASVLIVQQDLLGNVLEVSPSLPELKTVIVIKEGGSGKTGKSPETEDSSVQLETVTNASGAVKGCPCTLIDFNCYKDFPSEFAFEKTSPDAPALMHFTSGTTGKPKGALHVHAALLGHFATTRHVLGLNRDDIYWCTADTAWVTGMSYGVFGPLSNAATQISIEGNLTSRIIFDTIQRYCVTVMYTAPTLLRMLMREKDETIRAYNLSSLKHIASVGEALNPEIIKWSREKLGLPVHDTWFQTETGCIMIANTNETDIRPGSMGKPIPPIEADVLDENFTPVLPGQVGRLAIKPPWPSMFSTYWNNHEAYTAKFKNGWYITGDNARKDADGYFWFVARDDDVINTAGHLISPFEVESALLSHPAVAETAVIGLPDPLIAEKIKAFIVIKDGTEPSGRLKLDLRSHVREMVSPYAVPQDIEFVETLPKTKTGKIMRRLLKARELGLPIVDKE